MAARLALIALLAALVAAPARAEPAPSLRLAAWHSELSRDGPGVLLRDIVRGDPIAAQAAERIAACAPDALLLMGFDWDHEGRALAAFQALLAERGHPMPHAHAPRPNRGLPSGIDLDGDGRLGRAGDAQGWGRFTGEGGMAILSRHPLEPAGDLSGLLWRDLPGPGLPEGLVPADALALQRLSTTGHWDVAMRLPDGGRLRLLAWHAGAPVFDGGTGRNRRRNADEARLWALYLDGALGTAPEGPLSLLGNANLDPWDGDGDHAAIRALLAHPRLQDPEPRGAWPDARPPAGGDEAPPAGGDEAPPAGGDEAPPAGGEEAPLAGGEGGAHRGDPALHTADFAGPGRLRVTYVLPSRELRVLASGLDGPGADRPDGASRHALVWVDIAAP